MASEQAGDGDGPDDWPPFVIHPTAVFTVPQATRALGLGKHTIVKEIRRGKLHATRRGGRYRILGQWLLDWIGPGEVRPCRRKQRRGGRTDPQRPHSAGLTRTSRRGTLAA